jgi:hypothetical protein
MSIDTGLFFTNDIAWLEKLCLSAVVSTERSLMETLLSIGKKIQSIREQKGITRGQLESKYRDQRQVYQRH